MIFNVNGGSGINVSDTTATPPKVRAGEIFYDANGVRSEGTMPNGTATTPNTSIAQSTPSFTWNGATVTASVASKTQNVTPTVSAGYIDSGSAGTITLNASSGTTSIGTKAATTITPSASSQKVIASGSYLYFSGDLTVAAIPSTYKRVYSTTINCNDNSAAFTHSGGTATLNYVSVAYSSVGFQPDYIIWCNSKEHWFKGIWSKYNPTYILAWNLLIQPNSATGGDWSSMTSGTYRIPWGNTGSSGGSMRVVFIKE